MGLSRINLKIVNKPRIDPSRTKGIVHAEQLFVSKDYGSLKDIKDQITRFLALLESIIMPQSDKIKLSLALSINDFCIQLHIESINKNNDVKTQLNTDWFKVVDQYNQLKRTIPVSQQHDIEKAWISLSPKISGYLLSLSNSK